MANTPKTPKLSMKAAPMPGNGRGGAPHPMKTDPFSSGMPSIIPGVGSQAANKGALGAVPGVPSLSLGSPGGNPSLSAPAKAAKIVSSASAPKPPSGKTKTIAPKMDKVAGKMTKGSVTPIKPSKGGGF